MVQTEPTLCNYCIKGVRHEGTPTGRVEEIGGIDVYVAIPPRDYEKDKALLYLPDAMGLTLPNARLLADDFALNGFQVYLIDYFAGDAVSAQILDDEEYKKNFDLRAWLQRHREEITRPRLDAVIAALKERGISQFGATGYCFGGKYVFNLAQENIIKVGAVAHPSLLQMPGDLEILQEKSKTPMLINSCDDDPQFPPEACAIADKIFGEGNYLPGYSRFHWPGCSHGFAVRGPFSTDPRVKIGKEGAFQETVSWMKKHL